MTNAVVVFEPAPIDKHRDENGLFLIQRVLLQEVAARGSWREACQIADVPESRFKSWLRRDDAFKQAYDNLFNSEELGIVKRELDMVAGKAVGVYEDALTADRFKTVYVHCPDCGTKFDTEVEVIDIATRLRAGDSLLKVSGLLKDKKEVSGTVTNVNVSLSFDEAQSLLAFRLGRPIPEHILVKLKEKGAINENGVAV